jgi:XTP/dITP diphosphohydrolase
MKIILATHNLDKQKELLNSLSDMNFQILTLDEFPKVGDIIEDGDTLTENALIKARTVNQITGLPAISDDTGLEVNALNGAPGIYSARYAGENCSYADNVNKLLWELQSIPQEERGARFRTTMAFVNDDTELIAHGVVEGCITEEAKGVGGFGYDPVFYHPVKEKTFAEMNIEDKNKISHRGIAIRNLKKLLRSFLQDIQIQETA